MKKSTILSIATVGAIAATSVGTFALWDKMEDKSTGTLTVEDKQVTVSATAMPTFNGTSTLGATEATYTSTASFNLTDTQSQINSLKLTPVLKDAQGSSVTSGATVTLKQTDDATFNTTKTAGEVTDSTVSTGTNAYDVEVTVTDESLAGKTLTVEVTALAQE